MAHQPVELAYYGRRVRSSLTWLALALFLGGSPLLVYYTSPDPSASQLVLATVLGVPLFALSLIEVGRSHVLLLDRHGRRLKSVEGFFARRKVRRFSFDEIQELLVTHGIVSTRKGGRSEWWHVHLNFSGNREIVLEEVSHDEACRRARYLGSALGVQPFLDGKPVVVALEAVPRAVTISAWMAIVNGLCFALVAFTLAAAIAGAWVHYLRQ